MESSLKLLINVSKVVLSEEYLDTFWVKKLLIISGLLVANPCFKVLNLSICSCVICNFFSISTLLLFSYVLYQLYKLVCINSEGNSGFILLN